MTDEEWQQMYDSNKALIDSCKRMKATLKQRMERDMDIGTRKVKKARQFYNQLMAEDPTLAKEMNAREFYSVKETDTYEQIKKKMKDKKDKKPKDKVK